ncbi:prepilin-type N-terminal cleavage/methylation domain-containing protein [Erysipelothrix inopinata]|uniref:Prepilin-type N-terminal cleavage/methylation domain-containing protein n=1 Tax=Erysipelothrix inopinata TaxID=225084 RepID=A0A7G9RXV2_9FIRM|nr:prepilin-type N-terminal cleavage/methylation domain-containing protein [Erysipelothrix inopinata]
MSKKGFTLLEMMTVLFVIGVLMMLCLLSIHIYVSTDPTSKLHYLQLKAMYERKSQIHSTSLWFNKNGNVNHAQSILTNGYSCTIQLGFGRFNCEKR